jgi:hypothetical protein
MTFAKFCSSSLFVQKTVVVFHGVLLAERMVKDLYAELYQVDGFYVEILYRKKASEIFQVKAYADADGIEAYLQLIDLSALNALI